MEYKLFKAEISDSVAWVTVNRPASMNALNSDFFSEFAQFLNNLEKQRGIKVLVITGEGRAFVAGTDIAEMAGMSYEQACCFTQAGKKLYNRLEKLEMPVIAAINGYALGAGLELALACDFRIAAKSAKLGMPETTLGLIPGYSGTQKLPRLIGRGNAMYLILTAEMVTAEEAMKMGLVQKVVPDDQLIGYVKDLCEKIASNGSPAVNKAKEIIRKGEEQDFKSAQKLESEAFSKLFDYPSTHEAMKAFLEKRKPDW